MNFTNNIFVIILILFFIIYYLFFAPEAKISSFKKYRLDFLVLSSIIFYMTWYPPVIVLLFYHAYLGYYFGRKLNSFRKKRLLFLIIFLSLLPLVIFKYFHFFTEYFFVKFNDIDVVLPLGLSFYTFSMIGYYIDIYYKRVEAKQTFKEILLFIAFWPHLAAGPVLRAKNIFGSIFNNKRLSRDDITLSLILIISGLIKKLLIADNIGAYVNSNISNGIYSMNIIDAWTTMIGFAVQIYADFSGYSDMAIGFALLLGFRLPANFNYPYRAKTLTEFWRRWHISLSSWFRDYLYIPLGGSRVGKIRTYLNIMIVFVLSGIWHGNTLGFAIWGGIHGIVISLEKILYKSYIKIEQNIRWFITFIIIVIAWSFFRLDIYDATLIVKKMFGMSHSLFIKSDSPYYELAILLMLIFPILEHKFMFYLVDNNGELKINRNKFTIVVLFVLMFLALTYSGSPLPFIYFDF